ncbi:MAG: ABC transporter ATP-binding protein [bacterium]|nr:ABC transporter ATP-binding protein [bacterium]
MALEPIISVRNVVKKFDGRTVLDGVNLDVMPGETMVIMGGSGSGKSTLLRLIIGSMKPDDGEILVFGKNLCSMSRRQLDDVRKRFGILFQSGALFNSMSLAENVALPLSEHTDLDWDTIDISVKIKLDLVGLLEHSDKYPSQISGGMKKRAGLARALALDPEILYYDEPSAGLDPVTSAQIDQLISNLSKKLGVTSVVVTHEMDSAFFIADRMAMLDKGRMLKVESRAWYETVRKGTDAEAADWPLDQRLIRQFLRGDAEGPITDRRDVHLLERRLLGEELLPTPSLMPSRA